MLVRTLWLACDYRRIDLVVLFPLMINPARRKNADQICQVNLFIFSSSSWLLFLDASMVWFIYQCYWVLLVPSLMHLQQQQNIINTRKWNQCLRRKMEPITKMVLKPIPMKLTSEFQNPQVSIHTPDFFFLTNLDN